MNAATAAGTATATRAALTRSLAPAQRPVGRTFVRVAPAERPALASRADLLVRAVATPLLLLPALALPASPLAPALGSMRRVDAVLVLMDLSRMVMVVVTAEWPLSRLPIFSLLVAATIAPAATALRSSPTTAV